MKKKTRTPSALRMPKKLKLPEGIEALIEWVGNKRAAEKAVRRIDAGEDVR